MNEQKNYIQFACHWGVTVIWSGWLENRASGKANRTRKKGASSRDVSQASRTLVEGGEQSPLGFSPQYWDSAEAEKLKQHRGSWVGAESALRQLYLCEVVLAETMESSHLTGILVRTEELLNSRAAIPSAGRGGTTFGAVQHLRRIYLNLGLFQLWPAHGEWVYHREEEREMSPVLECMVALGTTNHEKSWVEAVAKTLWGPHLVQLIY